MKLLEHTKWTHMVPQQREIVENMGPGTKHRTSAFNKNNFRIMDKFYSWDSTKN